MLLLCVQGRLWESQSRCFLLLLLPQEFTLELTQRKLLETFLSTSIPLVPRLPTYKLEMDEITLWEETQRLGRATAWKHLASLPQPSKALSKLAPLWAAYGKWGQSQRKGTDKCPSNVCSRLYSQAHRQSQAEFQIWHKKPERKFTKWPLGPGKNLQRWGEEGMRPKRHLSR